MYLSSSSRRLMDFALVQFSFNISIYSSAFLLYLDDSWREGGDAQQRAPAGFEPRLLRKVLPGIPKPEYYSVI